VWWPERWVAAPTGGRDPAGHNGVLEANGAQLVAFDEEETAIVQ
jgi:hypothetical protein